MNACSDWCSMICELCSYSKVALITMKVHLFVFFSVAMKDQFNCIQFLNVKVQITPIAIKRR